MTNSLHILLSNNIISDRRMLRIADALQGSNRYSVSLIGCKAIDSNKKHHSIRLKHLNIPFERGPLFYLSLNWQMFFHLRSERPAIVYAVDLDTMLAARMYMMMHKAKLIFDSHELFDQVPELARKRVVQFIWRSIAAFTVPRADLCLTVSASVAKVLHQRHNKTFHVILNVPRALKNDKDPPSVEHKKRLLHLVYLGVLNVGRGLIELIDAMRHDERFYLDIIGDGPLRESVQQASKDCDHIQMHGTLTEDQFSPLLARSDLGILLLDGSSLSYTYSLANKFFDYIHHGLPVLTMYFPEYIKIHEQFSVCVFCKDLFTQSIKKSLEECLDESHLNVLKQNTFHMRKAYQWDIESQKLLNLIGEL